MFDQQIMIRKQYIQIIYNYGQIYFSSISFQDQLYIMLFILLLLYCVVCLTSDLLNLKQKHRDVGYCIIKYENWRFICMIQCT